MDKSLTPFEAKVLTLINQNIVAFVGGDICVNMGWRCLNE